MFKDKYSEHWETERKKKNRFIHQYNAIPETVLEGPIFEVGAGEGLRQIECRHKEIFLNSDYLGIDLLQPLKPELHIIQGDILHFKSDKKFKTILVFGVLEHISLNKWPLVVKKLKNLCMTTGNIVIYVPYQESMNQYLIHKEDHLVFGITKEFMGFFFPNATIKIIYNQMIRRYGESFLWAIGRWIKRMIMLDKKTLKVIPKRIGLLVIWEKK